MPDPATPHGAGPAAVPVSPPCPPGAHEPPILRAAGGGVVAAVAAVLLWSFVWDVDGSELVADVLRGAAVGGAAWLLGWLAADRGRWRSWGAVVITVGAGVPAAAAMILLTRRVDPSLIDPSVVEPRPATWTIVPLFFVVVAARSAWSPSGSSGAVPVDAWLASVVVAVVVGAASFGLLTTVARPTTADDLLCSRFDDWAAVREVTSGGEVEIVRRQEFFTTALERAPDPATIELVNQMLELSYRIDAAMSPGGTLTSASTLEQTLRAQMEQWRGATCGSGR